MLPVLLSTTIRVITEVKICCGLTRLRLVSPQHFDHCDDAYSLSIRVQTTLNHIRFVKQTVLNHIRFVFYHNVKVKKMFFSECELKKALRDTLSSAVWILIDNGKLANQIARLIETVVKLFFTTISTTKKIFLKSAN